MKTRSILLAAAFAVVLVGVALSATACGMKRDIITIEANQTAFQIPIQGDRSNQAQLFSEEFLSQKKVSVKQVFVEYKRIKNRSFQMFGKWYPTTKVIVVDLKPVTRAWTKTPVSGTSGSDQALVAETKESVAFSAEMNCNAAVDEANAAQFVHYYYGKSLEEVMDSQVRPYAQQLFTEKCAEFTLDELLLNKAVITKYVREGVTKQFALRGINVMSLGMQGEITYLNDAIQQSIDKRIQSTNDYLAQQAQNKKRVEMAEAANKEAALLSGDTAIKLRQLDIDRINADANKAAVEKWNGVLPTQMIPGSSIPFINLNH